MAEGARGRLLRTVADRLPQGLRRHALLAAWGARERFITFRDVRPKFEPEDAGEWPLPPRKLRVKVIGETDATVFIRTGRAHVELIADMLATNAAMPGSADEALDFGCGCGRLARWWPSHFKGSLHGCDANPELVAWCQRSLPFLEVASNGLAPPLPYEDERFSLVYALSVFTHMPRELEQAWLAELRRVLRPGGHLFFTLHGAAFEAAALAGDERDRFARGEPVTRFPEGAGSNLCATYHPPTYVKGPMLAGFELVDERVARSEKTDVTQAFLPHDAYLAKKL